jgi:hypothetical protein
VGTCQPQAGHAAAVLLVKLFAAAIHGVLPAGKDCVPLERTNVSRM